MEYLHQLSFKFDNQHIDENKINGTALNKPMSTRSTSHVPRI